MSPPLPDYPPAENSVLQDLPFHLARAALAFRRYGDHTLRELGWKTQAPGIATVLHAIAEHDGCPVGRLVELTELPHGTLTGLLDRLEADGHVLREPSPEDGRSWCVRLTPTGRRLCATLQKRHRRVMALFAETLSPSEIAELTRLLARVSSAMRAASPAPARSIRRRTRPVEPPATR